VVAFCVETSEDLRNYYEELAREAMEHDEDAPW
jgi:hypothetical protein